MVWVRGYGIEATGWELWVMGLQFGLGWHFFLVAGGIEWDQSGFMKRGWFPCYS